MSKRKLITSITILLILLINTTVLAGAQADGPGIIPLPNGFRPEGITVGMGDDFYVGSLADGAIYKGSLSTGAGAVFIPGAAGRISVGMDFDERSGYLFVAGGPTGNAYVYDTNSASLAQMYMLSEGGSFVNDVLVTPYAAFFTDSSKPVLYRLALTPQGGLPGADEVGMLPLSGDWVQIPNAFNANGIDALYKGSRLLVVNSTAGKLFQVLPWSGKALEIDLGEASVSSGDGILLDRKYVYVVRNFLNQIAVVRLSANLATGQVVDTISDPAFRIPTTIAGYGDYLYAVNARFDVAMPGPDTEYEVVRVMKTR